MEVKQRATESLKMATKGEGEKKTKKDDMMINDQETTTTIKGHIRIIEGFRQGKTRRDDQSSKSLTSSSSSLSSYVMKIKMGNHKNSIQRSDNTKKMENNHKNKTVMNLKQNTEESTKNVVDKNKMMKKKVWDCESTLYDSFELNSFNRQLDSAISSSARSMSMPHLSPHPPSETTSSSSWTKKQSPNKISRSLRKLIKSMFRQKESNARVDMDKYYVVFDKTGSLTTIPESGESTEMVGSDINSLVRKTASERFPRNRLVGNGLSCS